MLIRDIHFYLDTAKEKHNLKSDRQLGQALNYSGNQIFYLRKQSSNPSDEKMVAIAKMAGESTEIALLDLAMWRTHGVAKNTYASILQKISQVTAMIIALVGFTLAPTPSHAAQQNIDNVSNDLSEYVNYGK